MTVPYVVVVNLLPQDATADEWRYVFERVFEQRETMLQSADDAARLVAPGQPGSKVKVWSPERWPDPIVPWLQARGVAEVVSYALPGEQPPATLPELDFPVGTVTERAAAKDGWPGAWYDANPYGNRYPLNGGESLHTGADLNLAANADRGKPVYAAAGGIVTYAQEVQGSSWGRLVVIRHTPSCYTRYAHLATVDVLTGQRVAMGQQIGTIGGEQYGLPDHLHFDISLTNRLEAYPTDWPGLTYSRLSRDYAPPLKTILENRRTYAIDLLPYFLPVPGGNGPLYELRRPDGSQERVQVQGAGGWFYVTKGTAGIGGTSEWEQLRADAEYIWRGLDTSPGGGRYYWQHEEGNDAARWCRRHMRVGETYNGPGHHVQFYTKADCQPSAANSGPATNVTTLYGHHEAVEFPSGIVLNDVVLLGREDGEMFYLARGFGMVGWKSPWGEAYIAEVHQPGARPDNVRERLCGG